MKRLCILFLVTWGFLFCFPNTLYARQTAAVVNGNDTAATAEEFEAWLHAHKTTGGTLTLTQDIYIEHDFDYLSGTMIRYLQPVTIDTGAHTIYVKGFLLMEALNYKLTIRGEGNEQGLRWECGYRYGKYRSCLRLCSYTGGRQCAGMYFKRIKPGIWQ